MLLEFSCHPSALEEKVLHSGFGFYASIWLPPVGLGDSINTWGICNWFNLLQMDFCFFLPMFNHLKSLN